jgi:hypothetical protein
MWGRGPAQRKQSLKKKKKFLMFVSRVQGHNQHYAPVPPPPTPPQVHNVESHNILEINSHL